MDQLWDVVSLLEERWWLLIAVVVWLAAAIGVALGTYDYWSIVWKMRRASRRMKALGRF